PPSAALDQLNSYHGAEGPEGREGRREQWPGSLPAHDRPEDQRAEPQIADPVQQAEERGLGRVAGRDPEEKESREQAELEPGGDLHPPEESAGNGPGEGVAPRSS